jgi:molecular chaperone GrpE
VSPANGPTWGSADSRQGADPHDPEGHQEPVVRDRRRIRADADTPLPAQDADPAASSPAGGPDDAPAAGSADGLGLTDAGLLAEIEQARAEAAERTADLQRVTAEYANYRRRVDRDRDLVREQASVAMAGSLLGVLDDIDRAKAHEELSQGFRSVAESLEQIVAKLGLTRFGELGDPFDPTRHEALIHGYSADVTEPTCTTIISVGYRMGDRIIRPARVGVSDPEPAGGGEE